LAFWWSIRLKIFVIQKLVYEKKEYTSKEALLFVKIGELRK
jgi:hypothetical protein